MRGDFAGVKYSAFVPFIMVHWCGCFGRKQCWVVLWNLNVDFGCIISHAQITGATYTLFILSWDVGRFFARCYFLLEIICIALAPAAECLTSFAEPGFPCEMVLLCFPY